MGESDILLCPLLPPCGPVVEYNEVPPGEAAPLLVGRASLFLLTFEKIGSNLGVLADNFMNLAIPGLFCTSSNLVRARQSTENGKENDDSGVCMPLGMLWICASYVSYLSVIFFSSLVHKGLGAILHPAFRNIF